METEEKIEDVEMESSVDENFADNSRCQECQPVVEALKSDNYVLESDNGPLMNELQSSKQSVAVDSNANGSSLGQITNGLVEDGSQENIDLSTDESSWSNRKEELGNLCEVLMEERDAATKNLREKEAELIRLRHRIVQSEQEKGKLRNQLLQALECTDEKEKSLSVMKYENIKLKDEVESLRRRILELETKNTDGKTKVGTSTIQDTGEAIEGLADLKSPKESVLVSSGVKTDAKPGSQENENLTTGPNDSEEVRASVKETASVASEDAVKRRETKRTSPNFYRHSLAGSLPRPYQSFDASRDDSNRQRRGSDTSGDSEAETQGVPNFMRSRAVKPFLKHGFTPVQFNYRPLPESISNRKESWSGQRTASMSEVVARDGGARDDSADTENRAKDLAAESSSDSESGVFSSSTGTSVSLEKNRETEFSEQLSSEERESEREMGVDTRFDEIAAVSFQFQAQPSDAQERSLRSQNSSCTSHSQVPVSNASTHEAHATTPIHATESAETSKESNVDDDEEKRQAKVYDMVGMWNRKSEVIDI